MAMVGGLLSGRHGKLQNLAEISWNLPLFNWCLNRFKIWGCFKTLRTLFCVLFLRWISIYKLFWCQTLPRLWPIDSSLHVIPKRLKFMGSLHVVRNPARSSQGDACRSWTATTRRWKKFAMRACRRSWVHVWSPMGLTLESGGLTIPNLGLCKIGVFKRHQWYSNFHAPLSQMLHAGWIWSGKSCCFFEGPEQQTLNFENFGVRGKVNHML